MIPATDSRGQGLANFFSPNYQAHNRACLTHLESLGLPLWNRRVLELGSGPGDHTEFYVRRQCSIVSVDARQDCLDLLKGRHPGVHTVLCDLNAPAPLRDLGSFEVIHCYGILYHLEHPSRLLAYMGEACRGLAIVETCVLGDKARRVDMVDETVEDYTQSSTGRGCRPTREWVFEELGRFFPFVYHTRTQPNHPEFPVDWNDLGRAPPLIRAVFVASKLPLDMPTLSSELLDIQERLDTRAYTAELELILAGQLTVMEEREQLIRRLHNEADTLRVTAEERLGDMQRKDAAIQELHTEAGRRVQILDRLRVEVETLQSENTQVKDEADALRVTAEERISEMNRRDAAIQELRFEAGRQAQIVDGLRMEVETLRSENAHVKDEAEALRVTAEEWLGEMQRKDAAIQELHSEAGRQAQILDRLRVEVKALQSENAQVKSEVTQLGFELRQLTRERDDLAQRVRAFEAESLGGYLRRLWKR